MEIKPVSQTYTFRFCPYGIEIFTSKDTTTVLNTTHSFPCYTCNLAKWFWLQQESCTVSGDIFCGLERTCSLSEECLDFHFLSTLHIRDPQEILPKLNWHVFWGRSSFMNWNQRRKENLRDLSLASVWNTCLEDTVIIRSETLSFLQLKKQDFIRPRELIVK